MARILVADDVPQIRLLMRAVLEEFGHEVSEAEDGASCLTALSDDCFDLLITDLAMPGMGGDAVISGARNLHPAMRIIAVSGSVTAPADGADLSLSKPLSPMLLAEKVDELLRG